jgi:hypothetical protein
MKGCLLCFLLVIAPSLGCQMRWDGLKVRDGSGKLASEKRAIGPVEQIELQGALDVIATAGAEPTLTVEADDNLLPIVVTKVQGNRLVVRTTENYRTELGIKVTLTTPAIHAVILTGSGDVHAGGLAGKEFEAALSGSGDIVASGKVDKVEAKLTGSGDIDLGGVEARRGVARVVGSGDIAVHARETLEATVTGSGDVVYQGNPKLTESITGSGTIRRAE